MSEVVDRTQRTNLDTVGTRVGVGAGVGAPVATVATVATCTDSKSTNCAVGITTDRRAQIVIKNP